ncbi:hypothetical protein JCM14469_16520 [Desulfatiferula olefinivorans]
MTPAMPAAKNTSAPHHANRPALRKPHKNPFVRLFKRRAPGRAAGGKGARKESPANETHAVRLYTSHTSPQKTGPL